MRARLSVLALAMVGVASAANAETIVRPPVSLPPIVDHAMPPRGAHKVAIIDEYGNRYDRWGNRLDPAGHVIAPPHTRPGSLVIQNGPRA
jgi:hypothetical protein